MEIFKDIFKICPRVQGQDFDALPTDEETASLLRDLGHTGKSIHSMMLLLIRCINPGELLLLSLTEVYLERQLVLTSFVSLEHKSFRRNKIGMHTSKDDYLINTLRFVSLKEETQIYGAILPESLTSPEMKETKAYKTYLLLTEEPTRKSKRVKRPAKKKEKVDVTRGKGIELLSQVALKEDAQFKEAQRKSKRDFQKTHPSGSGAIKIIPSVTSEGTGVKLGVPDVTEEESSKSEAESWGNDKDDSNNEQDSSGEDIDQKNDMKDKLVKPPSNDSDDEDETKITDKAKGDEDKEIDYTTSQVYDDVDMRLNEPVDTDKGFVQEEGTDVVMTNV
ncbi:hypothetical protein Tco_0704319 [Tanacetum coccineum]|uniref:Uncharacterized protein n=1 Tax=Tanacetum coccineum TaxID=301880 RepID=A0ABQ4Y3D0_9ASTR